MTRPFSISPALRRSVIIVAVTLLCCAALLRTAFYHGVERGMDAALDEPGYPLVALAAAIGDMAFGSNAGYVADPAVLKTLFGEIVGPAFTEAARPRLRNAPVINHAINKVYNESKVSGPSKGLVVSMYFNDLGFIDYIKLAFRLFDMEIQSLYRLFFVLLAGSLVVFVLAFPGNVFASTAAIAISFVFLAEINSAIFNDLNHTVYGFRYPSVLGVIPTLHLALLVAQRERFTPLAFCLALPQALLLIFAISMRSSAQWGLIALFAIASLQFVQALWANWSRQQDRRILVLDAGCAFIRWPLLLTICLVLLHGAYMRAALHPVYDSDDVLPQHVFWHTSFVNYAAHDSQALALAEGATGDEIGYKAARLYAKRVGLAANPESLGSPLTNTTLRQALHDKLMRRVFLSYILANPFRVLNVYLYEKPTATIRNFMRVVRTGFPNWFTIGSGIVVLTFFPALLLLPRTVDERRAIIVTLGAMAIAVPIPILVGASYPYFYLSELLIVWLTMFYLGIPLITGWALAGWTGAAPERRVLATRILRPAIVIVVCLATAGVILHVYRTSPVFDTWTPAGLLLRDGATQAPDGTWTAAKVGEDGSDSVRGLATKLGMDTSKNMVARAHAKEGSGSRLLLSLAAGSNQLLCDFDPRSGTTAVRALGVSQPKGCTAIKQREGWWLVELTGVVDPRGKPEDIIYKLAPTQSPFVDSYRGNGSNHIFLWGASVQYAP